jgi:hypothetical protein
LGCGRRGWRVPRDCGRCKRPLGRRRQPDRDATRWPRASRHETVTLHPYLPPTRLPPAADTTTCRPYDHLSLTWLRAADTTGSRRQPCADSPIHSTMRHRFDRAASLNRAALLNRAASLSRAASPNDVA